MEDEGEGGVDSCQSVSFGEESIPVNQFHSEDAIPVYRFHWEESIPVNCFHSEESIPVNMKFPTITLCKPFQLSCHANRFCCGCALCQLDRDVTIPKLERNTVLRY